MTGDRVSTVKVARIWPQSEPVTTDFHTLTKNGPRGVYNNQNNSVVSKPGRVPSSLAVTINECTICTDMHPRLPEAVTLPTVDVSIRSLARETRNLEEKNSSTHVNVIHVKIRQTRLPQLHMKERAQIIEFRHGSNGELTSQQ